MIRMDMPRTLWGPWVTVLTCVGLINLTTGCVTGVPSGALDGLIDLATTGTGLTGGGAAAVDPATATGIFVNTSSDSPLLGLLRGGSGALYVYGERDGAGNPSKLSSLLLETGDETSKGTSLTLLFNERGLPSKLELADGSGYEIDYGETDLVLTILTSDGESQEISVPLDYYDPATGQYDRDKVHELEQTAAEILERPIDLDPLLDFIEAAQLVLSTGKNVQRGHFFAFVMAAFFGAVVYIAVSLATMIALAAVKTAVAATAVALSAAFMGVTRVTGSTSLLAAELAEEAAVAGSHPVGDLHLRVSAPPRPGS